MDVLKICDVSFIRCLKPNQEKQKENFQNIYVLQQIKYLGVLESIKIRKDGFPFRKDYKLFFQQYFELNIELDKKTELDNLNSYSQNMLKDKCWRIMRNILFDEKDPKEKKFKEKALFGHTKINAKQEIATLLDKLMLDPNRKKILELKLIQMKNIKSIIVQSFCKMVVPRKKYLYKKLVVKKLNQTFAKNWNGRTTEFVQILRNINIFHKKWRKVENKMVKYKLKCFLNYKQKAQLKTKFLKRRQSATKLNEFWEKKIKRRFLAKMSAQVNLLKNIEKFSLSIENLQILYKKKLDLFFLRSLFICLSDRKVLAENFLKAHNILIIICQKNLKINFDRFKKKALYQKEEEKKDNKEIICHNLPFSIGNSKLKKVFDENFSTPELTKIILEKLYIKKLKSDYKAMQKKLLIFLTRKMLRPAFQIFITANQEYEFKLQISNNHSSINHFSTALEIKELPTKLCGIITLSLQQINHENYNFSISLFKRETQEFFSNDSPQTPFQKLIFDPEPNVILYENIEDSIDALIEFDFEEKKIPDQLTVRNNPSFLSKMFPRFSEINIDLNKQKKEEKSLVEILKFIRIFYEKDLPEESLILCARQICQEAYSNSTKAQEEIYNQIIKNIENYLEKTKLGIISNLFNIKNDYEGYFLRSLKLLIIVTACLPSFKSQNNLIMSLISKKVIEIKTSEELKKYSCYALRRLDRNLNIKPKMEIPEKNEILKVLRMKKNIIRIKIIQEKDYKLQIETFDTVKDVLSQAIDKLELNHLAKYMGIYIDYEEGMFLEEENNFEDQIRYFRMKAKKEISIFLRIKLFPQKNLFFNTDFVCLIYTQMFYDYILNKHHLSKEAVYELSAWAYFINEGKYSGNQHIKIANYCPRSYNKSGILIETTEKIKLIYREISENSMTKKIAMGNFISKLRQVSDEMHHSFEGNFIKITVSKYRHILEEKISNEVILFVKDHEFMVLNKNNHSKNKEVFEYKNIFSYGCYECLGKKKTFAWREVGENDYLYFFESSKSDQIERLMEGYLKLLLRNN